MLGTGIHHAWPAWSAIAWLCIRLLFLDNRILAFQVLLVLGARHPAVQIVGFAGFHQLLELVTLHVDVVLALVDILRTTENSAFFSA